jgi:ribonuclease HI
MAKFKLYVVWKGRATGIFDNWTACKEAINFVSGAEYESFGSRAEAEKAFTMTYQQWQDYKRKREEALRFPGLW